MLDKICELHGKKLNSVCIPFETSALLRFVFAGVSDFYAPGVNVFTTVMGGNYAYVDGT